MTAIEKQIQWIENLLHGIGNERAALQEQIRQCDMEELRLRKNLTDLQAKRGRVKRTNKKLDPPSIEKEEP